MTPNLDIAAGLLAAERERLLRDHYETHAPNLDPDSPAYQSCDGCARAYAVRREIATLDALVGFADSNRALFADNVRGWSPDLAPLVLGEDAAR